MSNPQAIKQQLLAIIGKSVTVVNQANEDTNCSALQISLHGILEDYTEHFGPDSCIFYVRVKECYEGSSGAFFPPAQVLEVETTNAKRIVITLR